MNLNELATNTYKDDLSCPWHSHLTYRSRETGRERAKKVFI